jgi:hypothetical protein
MGHGHAGCALMKLCLQPPAQPRIQDLRPVFPEAWAQGAENAQMVQMQFDKRAASRKVALGVLGSYVKADNAKSAI